eukprot:TRINITY_DN1000_c0_g1_i10.p1 TRINITY_DN1000_c0_g1~~TRINITY_DN1000_c0_g1_i10.p1  ORF type:complete len:498 (+),score=77.19 TRINITY_DN1000_c0_g1_i10:113-1495(+)
MVAHTTGADSGSAACPSSPASDDAVARWTSPRPCGHNDWDNVRMKNMVTCLRCRVCQGIWHLTQCKRQGCVDFSKGRCQQGDLCPALHVHRRKMRVEERYSKFGSDLITNRIARAALQAGAHGPHEQQDYPGPAPQADFPGSAPQSDCPASAPQKLYIHTAVAAAAAEFHRAGMPPQSPCPPASSPHATFALPPQADCPAQAPQFAPTASPVSEMYCSQFAPTSSPVSEMYYSQPGPLPLPPSPQSDCPASAPQHATPEQQQTPLQPIILPAVAVAVTPAGGGPAVTAAPYVSAVATSPPTPTTVDTPAQVQRISDDSFQRGFQQGYQDGYVQGQQQPLCQTYTSQSSMQQGAPAGCAAPLPPQQQYSAPEHSAQHYGAPALPSPCDGQGYPSPQYSTPAGASMQYAVPPPAQHQQQQQGPPQWASSAAGVPPQQQSPAVAVSASCPYPWQTAPVPTVSC